MRRWGRSLADHGNQRKFFGVSGFGRVANSRRKFSLIPVVSTSCCTALEFNPTLAISKSNNSSHRIPFPPVHHTMRALYVCYSNDPLPSNIVSNRATTSCPPPLWNYALWQVISVLGMSLDRVIPPRMLSTRRECACLASRHLAYDVSFSSFSPSLYMLRLSQQTTHTFLAHCGHLEPGGLPIQIANSSVCA